MSKLDEMLERDAKIREIQAQIYMSRSNMGLWMRLLRWFWRKKLLKLQWLASYSLSSARQSILFFLV